MIFWDNAKSLHLVKLYESHPILWDHKHKNHFNKSMKEEVWKSISFEMKCPVVEAKKKIIRLMGSFRREQSREKRSVLANGGTYVSKWFAFNSLKFLLKRSKVRKPDDSKSEEETLEANTTVVAPQTDTISLAEVSSDDQETDSVEAAAAPTVSISNSDNSDFQPNATGMFTVNGTEANTKSTQTMTSGVPLETKNFNQPDDKVSSQTPSDANIQKQNMFENTDDSYDIFGKYVASELRKYDSKTLTHVKKSISDIIFEADIGRIPRQNNYVSSPNYLYSTHTLSSSLVLAPFWSQRQMSWL